MPAYLTPGVHVEEVSGGARPISGVSTSEAAFFGFLPFKTAPKGIPIFVTNWSAFEREFVGDTAEGSSLANAVAGFFQNGGRRLYVVNLGAEPRAMTAKDMALLDAFDTISLIAAPGLVDGESHEAILTSCEARRDRFAVLDLNDSETDLTQLTKSAADGGLRPRTSDRGVAAVYTPWIEVADAVDSHRVPCPPSGHICGLYAMTDSSRGVWKAPANASLRGALGLTRRLSAIDQEVLNPEGVNVIRLFPDGIRVWGARTLGDPAGDWRYVPVRRLSTMIAQSIQQGTRWVVFEPNDIGTWKSLRRDIDAFLHSLWRGGALAGAKPEEAFFVKCDAETTTQADIDAGRVIAVIGIAPVKPAEFVIIQIGQTADSSNSGGA